MHGKEPFPYWVIDGFMKPAEVRAINAEWPKEMEVKDGKGSIKRHTTKLPPAAARFAEFMQCGAMIDQLERMTGIKGLIADKTMFGGGLHEIGKGGYLKMHVDFNLLPPDLYRRVNVLVYLNEDWQDKWGGHLLLGENKEISISPIAGRCAIFTTSEQSWHGHPYPLKCPKNRSRRSMAFYYYTKERPYWFTEHHTTIYKKGDEE
jgi:Rps23 Pro-64 3,4-dihydroxylase Tpa1-like proline 4-hydroxylase